MVYLNYISRVPVQNGISQLYIEGSRPEWYISTIYLEFRSRMVYLNYISRVPVQNGISQLYIEGSRPEWYISTIYRGFRTRMVHLNHRSRVPDQNGISQLYRRFRSRMVYLNKISRVPVQNGISQLYIEGSGPKWYISTVQHACDIPFWSRTPNTIVEIYRSVWKPSIYQAHSCPPPSTTSRNNLVKNQGHWNIFRDTLHRRVHTDHNNNCTTQTLVHAYSPQSFHDATPIFLLQFDFLCMSLWSCAVLLLIEIHLELYHTQGVVTFWLKKKQSFLNIFSLFESIIISKSLCDTCMFATVSLSLHESVILQLHHTQRVVTFWLKKKSNNSKF